MAGERMIAAASLRLDASDPSGAPKDEARDV